MGEFETKDGTIVRAGGTSVEPSSDAYLIDVRYDRGVRRASVTALVGPLLPDPWQSTALTNYSPAQQALTPARTHPSPPSHFASRTLMSFVATACAVAISFGAYAAIRIQLLTHELTVQRRTPVGSEGTSQHSQGETDALGNVVAARAAAAARNAVAAMAVDLKKAQERSDRSLGEVKLRDDALLAASSGVDNQELPAMLDSYIKRLAPSDQPVDTYNAMGGLLAARDLAVHAQTCFTAALDAPACTKSQRLLALAGLADACLRQSKLDQADSLYRELVDLERSERELTPRALEHLADLVKIKVRRGLEDDADDAVSSLFSRLNDRTGSIDMPAIKQLLVNLAEFAIDNGNPALAIRLLERAVLLQHSASPNDQSAPLQQMLLTLHAQTGGDLEARRLMRKVLQQQTAKLGNEPEVAKTAMQLAAIDERLGDLNSAEKMLKLALDIRERSYGTNHLEVADTAYALARVYERQGRRSEAEALLGLVKGIWTRKREADRSSDPRLGDSP